VLGTEVFMAPSTDTTKNRADVSVRPKQDVPAIACSECGHSALQLAQLVDSEGQVIGQALVCAACQLPI
jgi:hypothetical protein